MAGKTTLFSRPNTTATAAVRAFSLSKEGIYGIFNGLIYCLGVYFVLNGNLQFGGLTLLISYFGIIWGPMYFFMYMGNDWARCIDAASRMFEILDSEPEVKDPKDPLKYRAAN